ncbi:NAD-dependent epimerase/dehydratase family protein [Sphingomonas yunnanensis]|uniref:NAD-dependent epimerase/dehydratase family protein n=1 Tax=Sphingomonas yunnanensis TaxID=310400 RepID=UPI001CA60563|nr:NAD-dependent epimerase/dehydratase family protein [Sphingomonas yunnanensis]
MIERPALVITGATGWIGQAVLMRLAAAGDADWRERVRLFGSRAATLTGADGSAIPVRALDTLAPDDVAGAHVVHLAYLTKEKAELLGERAFTDTNLAIDDRLLAACAAAAPAALFVASSGAAALAAEGRDRHPYGMCKLRQEDRLIDWGARAGVPVLAGRIWNIAGPYMNKTGAYALSDMLLQARRERRIRVAATIPVYRSYLHVEDLATLIIGALAQGIGSDRPLDLCGAEVLEMGDIAACVAIHCGLSPDAIERSAVDTRRSSIYLGSFPQTKGLALRLGVSLADFPRQLSDTAVWLEKHE